MARMLSVSLFFCGEVSLHFSERDPLELICKRCLNKMLSEKQMHRGGYRSYANAVTTAFL